MFFITHQISLLCVWHLGTELQDGQTLRKGRGSGHNGICTDRIVDHILSMDLVLVGDQSLISITLVSGGLDKGEREYSPWHLCGRWSGGPFPQPVSWVGLTRREPPLG